MSNIDRIMKLIALAGSANENEARSAAHLACKLIREGEYRIVDASEPEPQAFDPWSMFREAARAAQQQQRTAYERRPPPDVRPRRAVPNEITRARRSGECAVCREPFEEGSDVAIPTLADDSRLGTVHADCRARWTVPVG